MKKSIHRASGFTLIELIVVIVIVGIMAAFAVPKFINLQSDARSSVIRGVEGSLRSAATLVYSKSLIDGTEQNATGTVTVSTGPVDIVFGYPAASATGIDLSVDLSADIASNGAGIFSLQTNCSVTYTAATNATSPAVVSVADTSGC